jgi:hypothetical protein
MSYKYWCSLSNYHMQLFKELHAISKAKGHYRTLTLITIE